MKVIITGSQGLLGHEVVRVCESFGDEVVETDITPDARTLDITDKEAIVDILKSENPQWIINCAAYTNVDGCEDNVDTAYALNARAPGYLAEACKEYGLPLLHVSTDYVYDGKKKEPYTEEDTTNPLSIYGKSKLAGEEAIQSIFKEHIIVRTQWLFGPHGKNFVANILGVARDNDSIKVVNDQWGSPTYSKDLAKAIRLLVECDARGIYHVCNRGRTTWYDLAKKAVELVELETKVIPVSTEEFPRPAKRPKISRLSTKKFTDKTGRLMPPWQISLQQYIKEYLLENRPAVHS